MEPKDFNLTHLQVLEAESIHIFREVAAEFERPVLLYSVGKDSSVLVHLARKAFAPGRIPFPLLHVDTGYKFQQMMEFRDQFAKQIGADLHVHRNEDAIAKGTSPYKIGMKACCGLLKTEALLQALNQGEYDAAIGGARRDEEKSRAKERFYSFRDRFGQWDPKNQRPELWNIFNSGVHAGESIRVFPLSNWTELDIWLYIYKENIEINALYFAQKREMIDVNGQLLPVGKITPDELKKKAFEVECRYRTLGCYPCTGAVRSTARSVPEIVEEMMVTRSSERTTRAIDHDAESSMEQKKREGYF